MNIFRIIYIIILMMFSHVLFAASASNSCVTLSCDDERVVDIFCKDKNFYISINRTNENSEVKISLYNLQPSKYRLVEPRNLSELRLSAESQIQYRLKSLVEYEPDVSGFIYLVFVDVKIENLKEEDEEIEGECLLFHEDVGNYATEDIARYLARVEIAIHCSNSDSSVTVVCNSSRLIARDSSGRFSIAKGEYTKEELLSTTFYLLGTQMSQVDRDQSIVVQSEEYHCQDIAKYTVVDALSCKIKSVSFHTVIDLIDDDSIAYTMPQFGSSDRMSRGEIESVVVTNPVACVRNRKFNMSAKIELGQVYKISQVSVKARSDKLEISPVICPCDGKVIIMNQVQIKDAIADEIDFVNPLLIDWQVSVDGGDTWINAGESTNRLYVTWAEPRCVANYETLFYIGCDAAKGTRGICGVDDELVLDRIWERFKSCSVSRASDGKILSYYGFRDNNENGVYDFGDDDMNAPDRCMVTTFNGLITNQNGQCNSWAELYIQTELAQGLVFDVPSRVFGLKTNNINGAIVFAINNWNRKGGVIYRDFKKYEIKRLIDINTNLINFDNDYLPNDSARDGWGVPGQGNSPNPPSNFVNHYISLVNGIYYDPSYALGPYGSLAEYESNAFSGYITNESKLWLNVPNKINGIYVLQFIKENIEER